MNTVTPNLLSDPRVFDVSTVRSFVETIQGLSSCPPETTLVAFRLKAEMTDLPPGPPLAGALHTLANLAVVSPMISLCHLEGPCTGAALGLALRCDVVTVTPSASITISWDHPAAAIVHASAAERVGTVACERLIFDRTCDAMNAAHHGLASFLCDDLDVSLTLCAARIRTTHATAKAFRLAFPFSMDIADALTEPFARSS